MESWRKAWRYGLAEQFSTPDLESLRRALIEDDERLLQSATGSPPPLQCMLECAVEAACAVTFTAWRVDGLITIGEVENYFAEVCAEVNRHLGEPAGCRWFLNAYDDTPRESMRVQLLAEVQRTLKQRAVRIE